MPELEARLAEAERAGRDAEVVLAQALAAQATEAADARVAAAALAAARARGERGARDLARVTAEAAALGDAAPLAAARAEAAAARLQALQQAEQARAALTRADGRRTWRARPARPRAQATRAAAHADFAALDSEAAALTKATRRAPDNEGGRERLIDRLRPDAGYERALAAALGDDLEGRGLDSASERFWAGAVVTPGDPGAPAGTVALGRHVVAPEALARRLAQVFVTDSDDAQPLAVGQRLVTMAGVLRRWDGYVAKSGGAAAAERLERINRLRAIDGLRPRAAEAVEAANIDLARIDAAIGDARAAAVSARRALEAADTQARDAARTEDRAAAAIERIDAQRADLAARRQRIADEHDEAQAEVARAGAAQAALPDGSAMRARVATLSTEAEVKRTAIATTRAERAGLDRDVGAARERLAGMAAEAKGWRARAGEAARRIADMDKRDGDLAAEAGTLVGRPEALAAEIVTLEASHAATRGEADTAAMAERAAETALRDTEARAAAAAETLAQAREARAGAAARAENQELRRIEMNRLSGERFQCPSILLPERVGFEGSGVRTPSEESHAHDKMLVDRERIGPVNLVAETELAELEAASIGNAAERAELGLAVNRLRGSIGTLNREGRQRLLAAFEAVDGHFRRLFTTLFNGGAAHLELIDSDDPLEAGLEIMAQPPGKKLQSLTLLSGGEQALTAVALIFGLFLTNPAPICVLDEVDAPLDDANIERFCSLLDAMTRETQTRYLIVTHNAVTMSRMHRLFGVTMVEQGVSRLVSVDLGAAETLLAAE